MRERKAGLQITGSLTAKLIIAISLLVVMGGGVYLYTLVKTEEKNALTDAVSYISSSAEMVRNSVRHDMLTANREEIQKTIEAIGSSESIETVRILDHQGRIAFSTKTEELGITVANDSSSCLGCHENQANPLHTIPGQRRWTIFEDNHQHRILSFVEPVYNEPACYTASCHAHPESQKVLGVLLTDFSLSNIDQRVNNTIISSSLYVLLFIALIAVTLSYILWQIILNPVSRMSTAMQQLTSGKLPPQIAIDSQDEIGMLAKTFNLMTDELRNARQKMENWTQSLEQEIQKKTEEITRTQDKLIQAEKMAALGRLTAVIAHEIKNPLAALGGFGRRLQRATTQDKQRLYADIIVSEAERLERVLNDILTFSREPRFHLQPQSVTEVVSNALQLYTDLCQEHEITLVADLNINLPVLLALDPIKQALNNLLSNAIYAMSQGGTLTVTTTHEQANDIEYVAIHIADTGPGIPADKLELIFEPFFTTKKLGKGTGLGLSISKKIIEEHGGFIKAENRQEGMIISLYLPRHHEEMQDETPCWEFMKCNRNVNDRTRCKAYPDFGRICWVIAGTLCEGKIQGTYAQKYNDCRNCAFYKKVIEKKQEDKGAGLTDHAPARP